MSSPRIEQCDKYIALFQTRRARPGRSECVAPAEPSEPARPAPKKPRIQSTEDILRELADKAIDAMRVQGLAETSATHDTSCDSRIGDNYDWFPPDGTDANEHQLATPQSPSTFLERVGFVQNESRERSKHMLIPPPVRPPLHDDRISDSQYGESPCTSPGSHSPRRKRTAIGDVTPATAHAAQCLLALTQ